LSKCSVFAVDVLGGASATALKTACRKDMDNTLNIISQ
jgi:hypothetical protein